MALDAQQAGSSRHKGEWHIITPEEEIRALEQKLAEKKRRMADADAAHAGAPEGAPADEKELFREVMREHIAEKTPSLSGASPSAPASAGAPLMGSGAQNQDDDAKKQAREEKIRLLIDTALSRTIESAVSAAQNESPYLLDELHDRLADAYYDKLVQLRKLEAL